jgi:hypothetical protein
MKQASILVLLASTLVCACATDARENAASTRLISYSNEGSSPAVLEIEGVRIEVLAPVKDRLSAFQIPEPVGSTRATTRINMDLVDAPEPTGEGTWIWLSGEPLTVRSGVLRIGESSFGPVHPKDSVRIDPEGVHVNEDLRGELPGR